MKTACKMVICLLVCLALSSCSRPVPDPIPDGTWTCEEESITLLLAGNDGIGLWNGSLITKRPYDWPG